MRPESLRAVKPSHWSNTAAASGPSILAASACARRHALSALVNAAAPALVIVTDIARPVAEVSVTATQPLSCMSARFRLTVDRSSISLAASAAGLTGPAAMMRLEDLHLGLGKSRGLQCLLVAARDDPVQPDDAHAEAGAADLRGQVIRDRVLLLHARPESGSRGVASTTL